MEPSSKVFQRVRKREKGEERLLHLAGSREEKKKER